VGVSELAGGGSRGGASPGTSPGAPVEVQAATAHRTKSGAKRRAEARPARRFQPCKLR